MDCPPPRLRPYSTWRWKDFLQYTPFEVSTQVVAGTIYRFECKTMVPQPNPIHGEAVVQIFQSLDGSAHITSITPI